MKNTATPPKVDSVLSCADCKQPMRKTRDGWVHVATGLPRCDHANIVLKALRARVRWPHIERDPQSVEHLRDIVGRLHTPMMEHTREAVVNCLNELHRRLLAEQSDQPQTPTLAMRSPGDGSTHESVPATQSAE